MAGFFFNPDISTLKINQLVLFSEQEMSGLKKKPAI